MSGTEILEGNKLIAEFMGATPCKDWQGYDGFEHPDYIHSQWSNRCQDYLELTSYRYSELRYHSSWNWLMLVVEKIESENRFGVCIDVLDVSITDYKENETTIVAINKYPDNNDTKMSMTFDAVIEFIEWYNAQEK